MPEEKQVSVIIPAFNAAHSIRTTLNSVRIQDYESMEVIVVDDGSTDSTSRIVKSEFPEVKLIQQKNMGQGSARNTGLTAARGKYIAFLDADDYWKQGFLRHTTHFLDNHEEGVAVSVGFLAKMARGEYVGPRNIDAICDSHPSGLLLDDFFEFWGDNDHIRTGTVLIRRGVIAKAGLQLGDLRISQDLEYWGYLATFGQWGLLPRILWVGDSARNAVKAGWRRKLHVRRRNCPSVEEWERRIVPRLTSSQKDGFQKVRGRVAASFAQNRLLGGDDFGALEIVRKYGDEMPKNRLTSLMKWGAKNERLNWRIISKIVQAKDWIREYGI